MTQSVKEKKTTGDLHAPIIATLTLVLGLATGITAWSTYTFGTIDRPGLGFYPLLVSIFLIISSIVAFAEWLFSRTKEDNEVDPKRSLIGNFRFYAVIAVIILIGPSIYLLGYLATVIPVSIVVGILVKDRFDYKIIVTAIIVPVVIFVLFEYTLGINLP